MSNSPRSRAKYQAENRRDSSAPEVVRRGASAFSLPLPSQREGAERRLALRLGLAPRRRCRVPCGHAASRRSTVASSTPGPARRVRTGGLSSPVIRAAFAALHPDRTGLLSKAALHFKGGREPRATRTSCVRNHRGAGATPAPPLRRLMMAPSREQACRQYRALRTAQH